MENFGTVRLSTSARLSGFYRLVRISNCLLIGFAVVVGEAIALGSLPGFDKAVFGFLTASLMMAGTMAMNDVYDLETDRVNAPDRPLPSGRVRVGEATVFSVVLSVASVAAASLLGMWTLVTAVVAFALMVYYNTRGKRTGVPGNIVVSFNVALPFFFGGVAVGSLKPLLVVFSALAFLSNLGREVAKGIPDAQGDRMLGVRTLAVLRGPRTAAFVSAGLFLGAVALSVLPPLLGSVSPLYWVVALADAGFVYSSARLVLEPNPGSVRKVKSVVLLWMLLGMVGFLLGGLTF